ncbi:MAG: Wzz/FepE/Etk N-terminal domain-containing protein [Desulfurivibrio sp.]|nr:Wzz/FepE/Etk N-terminal domain-containing protein [Desulfurivibrio sp.]
MTQDNSRTPPPAPYYDDEISLIDLALVIWKNRWLALVVAALVTAGGIAYALLQEPRYEYTTLLEIGTTLEQQPSPLTEQPANQPVNLFIEEPLEESATVKEKLENIHIPEVIQKYRDAPGAAENSGRRLEISVSIPQQAGLVKLHSEAPAAMADHYLQAQREVAQRLQEAHRQLRETRQRDIKQALNEKTGELDRLGELGQEIKAELEGLATRQELLQQRQRNLREYLAEAEKQRAAALAGARADSDTVVTLLAVGNELQRHRGQLHEIEEQLLVELPHQRLQLENQLADNHRRQELQRQETEDYRHRLDNLPQTQLARPPRQSPVPVDDKRRLIIALSLVLGVMLGLFAVFIAEFGRRLRRELQNNA